MKKISDKTAKMGVRLILPPTGPGIHNVAPLGLANLQAVLKKKKYDVKVIDMRPDLWQKVIHHLGRPILKYRMDIKNRTFMQKKYHYALQTLIKATSSKPSPSFDSLNSLINAGLKGKIQKKILSHAKKISKNVRLVGISVIYPYNIKEALHIARVVKKYNPSAFVVVGGPQVTKHIRFLTKSKISSLIDGLIIRDGELPVLELADALSAGKSPAHVSNIYYSDGLSYSFSHKLYTGSSSDITKPDFSGMYFGTLPVRSSVGCFWGKCAFCTYCKIGAPYSALSPGKVVKIIRRLKKEYNWHQFRFVDDMLHPNFLKRFSRLVLEQKLNIKWSCSMGLIGNIDKATAEDMKKAGCINVSIGLESMNERVLRLMNKPHNPVNAKNMLRTLKTAGLHISVYVIFGFPTETKDEAIDTLNFLKMNKHLYDSVGLHKFALEENTDIFDNWQKYGIKRVNFSDKEDTTRLGYDFVSDGMEPKELEAVMRRAEKIISA